MYDVTSQDVRFAVDQEVSVCVSCCLSGIVELCHFLRRQNHERCLARLVPLKPKRTADTREVFLLPVSSEISSPLLHLTIALNTWQDDILSFLACCLNLLHVEPQISVDHKPQLRYKNIASAGLGWA